VDNFATLPSATLARMLTVSTKWKTQSHSIVASEPAMPNLTVSICEYLKRLHTPA